MAKKNQSRQDHITRPDGKPYLAPGEATRIAREAAANLSAGLDNTGWTVPPKNPHQEGVVARLTEEEIKKLGNAAG